MSHYLPECVYAFFEYAPVIKFQAVPHHTPPAQAYDATAPIIQHLPSLTTNPKPSLNEINQNMKMLRDEKYAEDIAIARSQYNREDSPLNGSDLTPDPALTLFIGRLDYRVDEAMLRGEFEHYGTVVAAHIVRDPLNEDKSRGYGFIQFSTQDECKRAFVEADGQKILDRHIVVEYERRRVDPTWFPRRLGGGEGSTRHEDPAKVVKTPGRLKDFLEKEERRRALERQEREREFQRTNNNNYYNNPHGGGHRGRYHNNPNNNNDRGGAYRDRDRNYHNQGGPRRY